MNSLRLTELLADRLGIEIPPVSMTFVDSEPQDVPPLYKDPPSFCSLWRIGEIRPVYVPGDQHSGCGIGGVVSGFLSAEGREIELAALLEEMCEASAGDDAQEIERTARFTDAGEGVVYSPLWKAPLAPDLILLWATLPQMGVLQDILGKVMWRDNPQGASFTRPACGVLPIAHTHQKPAMSLGCVGMRLYTGLPPSLFLLAVPSSCLDTLEQGLGAMNDAGDRLRGYAKRMATGGGGR